MFTHHRKGEERKESSTTQKKRGGRRHTNGVRRRQHHPKRGNRHHTNEGGTTTAICIRVVCSNHRAPTQPEETTCKLRLHASSAQRAFSACRRRPVSPTSCRVRSDPRLGSPFFLNLSHKKNHQMKITIFFFLKTIQNKKTKYTKKKQQGNMTNTHPKEHKPDN